MIDEEILTFIVTMYNMIQIVNLWDCMESEMPFEIKSRKLKEVTEWFIKFNGKKDGDIGLRVLNKVIQNIEARESFKSGEKNLKEAAELTDLVMKILDYILKALQI